MFNFNEQNPSNGSTQVVTKAKIKASRIEEELVIGLTVLTISRPLPIEVSFSLHSALISIECILACAGIPMDASGTCK